MTPTTTIESLNSWATRWSEIMVEQNLGTVVALLVVGGAVFYYYRVYKPKMAHQHDHALMVGLGAGAGTGAGHDWPVREYPGNAHHTAAGEGLCSCNG